MTVASLTKGASIVNLKPGRLSLVATESEIQ